MTPESWENVITLCILSLKKIISRAWLTSGHINTNQKSSNSASKMNMRIIHSGHQKANQYSIVSWHSQIWISWCNFQEYWLVAQPVTKWTELIVVIILITMCACMHICMYVYVIILVCLHVCTTLHVIMGTCTAAWFCTLLSAESIYTKVIICYSVKYT